MNDTANRCGVSGSGQVWGGIRQISAPPRPPCVENPSAWPSPRQTTGPSCPYPRDRSPSGHPKGRRQARHAHILQIGLRLAILKADDRPLCPYRSDRPPSGHRQGRYQARHSHILQIDHRLAILQADARPVMLVSFKQSPPDATMKRVNAWRGPAPLISARRDPIGGILRRESHHMPIVA